jgi:thioredoxin-dependent peroxiredoxin
MASITLGGNPVKTIGNLPQIGDQAPNFTLSSIDLSTKDLTDFLGSKVILNIFPSVGTGICSASVRRFNVEASKLKDTKILCISKDLPFAQNGFCASEGIENVEMLSNFIDNTFGKDYGVLILDGKFKGLLARAILVLDEKGKIVYSEQVPEIGQEPNYELALNAVS